MSVVVDLATAKQWLQIAHSKQDVVVQAVADGIEDYVSKYLGVSFTSGALNELLSGGTGFLLPTNRPVTVLTIQTGDTIPKVLDTLTSQWMGAILIGDGRIARADDQGKALLRPDYYNWTWDQQFPWWARWPDGLNRFQAYYTGGYAAVPAGLKVAILKLISRAYNARAGEMSNNAAGASVNFGALLDSDAIKMLQPYSRRRNVRVG